MSESNTRRIAKNTVMLYMRTLFTMFVSFYTSRIVLRALGVEDYGIYGVVGSTVAMFSMLSGSLSSAVSRFITFELGCNNKEKLRVVFSTALTIQIVLSVVFLIVAETVGIWYINNKMVISPDRVFAANWVFQFSVMTFVIGLISVPYNAAIIAHEKMSTFAYIGIFEAVAKLLIAYLISVATIDRLILYGFLLMLTAVIVRLIYGVYCKRKFEECTYRFVFDKKLLKDMTNFAGWNFIGASSSQLMNQGVNLLANNYFGLVVNAARGITTQVDSMLVSFVNNFTTAVNPQITKSCAAGNYEYMHFLIFRSAKFSYFLIMFFAIPILCETNFLLNIWLDNIVPEHTVTFVKLALVTSMIHVLSNSMITAILATGNIKKYQIVVGGIGLLVLPIAWGFFHWGFPPETAYVVMLFVFICQFLCRLCFMRTMIGMSIKRYVKEVLLRILFVSLFAMSFPMALCVCLEDGWFRFLSVGIVSVISSGVSIYVVGLGRSERDFFLNYFKESRYEIDSIHKKECEKHL